MINDMESDNTGARLPAPEEFITSYGLDAPVAFDNGMETTLGQALELEAMFCEASDDKRMDPQKRLRYLAQRLGAAGTLRAEHAFLAEAPEVTE